MNFGKKGIHLGGQSMFNSIYKDKTVLLTGHTGFKGSWLTAWLENLGAKVVGISKDVPTNPSHFETLDIQYRISHNIFDITDVDNLRNIFKKYKPDFVFHLAAQAIVSDSHYDPINTVSSNVLGTTVLLQVLREQEHEIVAVIITSDKCYENNEWIWGYRENDTMGGKDIYSASKGAAELIFSAFYRSILSSKPQIKLATARAGNVIGGGDWAKDRIVADSFKSWSKGNPVEIRNPSSTRPWQHVLEPLSGYLQLGSKLYQNNKVNGGSYNFGPESQQNITVKQLINDLLSVWDNNSPSLVSHQKDNNSILAEAGLLRLNCEKAENDLGWKPTLDYKECVDFVGSWYKQYYSNPKNSAIFTQKQIKQYTKLAHQRGKIWSGS